MLEFSARHEIASQTEMMALSEVNEAIRKRPDESLAHRIVLQNDFDSVLIFRNQVRSREFLFV